MIRRVREVNPRRIGRVRLGHLLCTVAQGHNFRAGAFDERLWQREEIGRAKVVIKLRGNIAGEFQMLFLIFADGNMGAFERENICGLQNGICIEPNRGALRIFAHLIFILGHTVEPSDARDAVKIPRELTMCPHRGLCIDNRFFRVDACRKISRRNFARLIGELGRVLRDRDGVQIDNTKDAIFFMLQTREFFQRAEVIPKVQRARGLHTRKDAVRTRISRSLFFRHGLSFRA